MSELLGWFEVEGEGPKWMRTIGHTDDGEIYVPANLAGNEKSVFLCAGFDAVPTVIHLKHAYVPASWIEQEYGKQEHIPIVLKGMRKAVKTILASEAVT